MKTKLPTITEAEFTTQVVQCAKLYGWLVYHALPGMNRRGKWSSGTQGDVGFPDVVCVHPKRGLMLVAELKVGKNKMTHAQINWHHAFLAADVGAYVWHPDDWPLIEKVFKLV